MGLCSSKMSDAERRSKELDANNKRDFDVESSKIKLLLLGAGESGKSTIFKQMKILYGLGFSEEEKREHTHVVYANVIFSMKTLIKNADMMGLEIAATESKEALMAADDGASIGEELGVHLKALWADEGIRAAYERRAEFQLYDSADYYLDSIDRIMDADYVCTDEDILKSRVRTSGIVEERYKIDGVDFVMFDVGGQRNERKKWIHCFDDVTAVIFVAAISEYDQNLYEDKKQNRIHEATELFDEICSSRWFDNTSMILFLNKKDLFEKKIKRVDIRNHEKDLFMDYDGGICTCDGGYPSDNECTCGVQALGKTYLTDQFLAKNTNEAKEVYWHITCATDTGNVKAVFNDCRKIILNKNLQGSGFME